MNNTFKSAFPHDLEFLARLMDDRFSFFGFRFGLNFIIDLVPWVGDIATSAIALYILGRAIQCNIPKTVIARMIWNIAIYFFVGLIPWIGDFFGAWWKPNRKNIELLKRALA